MITVINEVDASPVDDWRIPSECKLKSYSIPDRLTNQMQTIIVINLDDKARPLTAEVT